MSDLQLAVEQYLASLNDDDWAALTLRVRPPKTEPAEPKPCTAPMPVS